MIREDLNDAIYKNEAAKFRAVVKSIKESHEKGQPVLVGTVSIEKSEKLSEILKREGIKHEVLNAKYHEKEAEIIAQAGKFGAVTISTNMAGRGTDIMLGGNSEYLAKQEMRKRKFTPELIEQATAFNETDDEEILEARKTFRDLEAKFSEEIKEEKQKVIDAGGLKIIGTERHESRRIDNQLRGRSGRQGDPGTSRFYIALDDDLMKIFGGDMITTIYDRLGADEDMELQNKMLSNAVESAQKRVEGRNFSIRKNVLQYDDVMNTQREIIYKQRRQVLDGEDLKDSIIKMMNSEVETIVGFYAREENINKEALLQDIMNTFNVDNIQSLNEQKFNANDVIKEVQDKIMNKYAQKEENFTSEKLREVERVVMLKVVDEKWMDHIDSMDELKDGIGLRAYGQKDPVVQYRIEGFDMFDQMIEDIKHDVVKILLHLEKSGTVKRTETTKITGAGLEDSAIKLVDGNTPSKDGNVNKTVVNDSKKIGRNDPCICRKWQKI